jgi:uncharacterized protein DUF6265
MFLDARRAAVWLSVGTLLAGGRPAFARPPGAGAAPKHQVQRAAKAAQPTIDRVAWLHGCWQTTGTPNVVEEQWMAPRGGTMIGMGRTVRGGKTTEYELVVLREQDGRLAYEAHPSDQPSAVFLSREITDSSVVFENAEHDFPQRVGYKRSESVLAAWIEGTVKGQLRHIDFTYARVACAH